MVEAAMKVIVVAMDFNNLSHIDNQLHKVELSASESPVLQAQLTAARALTCLKRGEFQDAAHKFAQVSPYLGDSLTQLICAEDVALYGTLCTLVSLEHEQVRNILLEPTSNFRNFVDLDPLVSRLTHYIYIYSIYKYYPSRPCLLNLIVFSTFLIFKKKYFSLFIITGWGSRNLLC